ncbi:sensor histidine kinase [Flaviaesturariibacter amylovorans]|uniref:histidine kinase n=1 Tax=Flaviaesturariibacter amylovorans TaxID=1084520 RepID=A0ABP8GX85_9BACT
MSYFSTDSRENRHARLVQSMLDASMHGIMLLEPVRDASGVVTDFTVAASNASSKQHVGFALDPGDHPLLSTLFPAYKEQGFFDAYVHALQSGTVVRCELYYKDEALEGWFDLGVAPQDDALVVTFVNISENRRNQQRTEEAASRLQSIMNVVQAGVFTFHPERDASGTITDFRFGVCNPRFTEYVGQTPDALTGDLGSKWFPSYKKNGLFDRYRRTYENGDTDLFEFHYNDDGIDVWLNIQATRQPDGILVTFTDHTAEKKLQLQLQGMVEELKRSNANLEEFAYAASHDLQEPLRKIHFFSNRLKESYLDALGSNGAAMLERMENATRRMRILIDDLLAYSRVSARRSQVEEVDLNAVVNDVLSDLETRITEKAATVRTETLPTIRGDKLQLRQLFQNLIGNALKYSREEAAPEVQIRCGVQATRSLPEDWPGKEGAQQYYVLEVADNGLGFEQQHARRIFQLFQRLHGRSEYEGTGIGLAIVQKVVENHEGFIHAEGRPGEGARFLIYLPGPSQQ